MTLGFLRPGQVGNAHSAAGWPGSKERPERVYRRELAAPLGLATRPPQAERLEGRAKHAMFMRRAKPRTGTLPRLAPVSPTNQQTPTPEFAQCEIGRINLAQHSNLDAHRTITGC
jgi:hypothetical protein